MTSRELTAGILLRIRKFFLLIMLAGVLLALLLFLYARSVPTVYSVRSSVFPLNSSKAGSGASSQLSALLGGSSGSEKISDEADVSIEEVGRSKKTAEAVAAERLPAYGNKMVGEILIKEYNLHRGFMQREIPKPAGDSDIISTGAQLLLQSYSVKFNKSNLLEIVNSSTDKNLLIPVNYLLVDNISRFYKELKIEKAKSDFDFIQAKVDSFRSVLNIYDQRQIAMNNRTLFVPQAKLQYSIPKENIVTDKDRVLLQYTGATSQREEALWRLQKETPIIKLLDKPQIPFKEDRPSKMVYATGGFIFGCLICMLACISGLLRRYVNDQIRKALAEPAVDIHTNITA